jgi:gluconate 2-dehydrogenase gamma chain
MIDRDTSRRDFLISSGTMFGAAWFALHAPAIRAAAAHAREAAAQGLRTFDVLTAEEATELEAIAAQIFPTDDTPGATEAGVVHFIDRALGGFASWAELPIREGLEKLRDKADVFSELPLQRQAELLREIEDTPFFGTVRTLTIMGMFAMPSYGGNRDKVGWKLLGFEDRFAWQPPFGYYDAEPDGRVERDGGGR